MGRIILGVVVGFVVWSVLWVGSSSLMAVAWSDYANAMVTMKFGSGMLLIALIRSFVFSIIGGFIAVLLSKEVSKTTIGLGVLLLLFGIFVQALNWQHFPIWYHIIFLGTLIPLTILGGKLIKREPLA